MECFIWSSVPYLGKDTKSSTLSPVFSLLRVTRDCIYRIWAHTVIIPAIGAYRTVSCSHRRRYLRLRNDYWRREFCDILIIITHPSIYNHTSHTANKGLADSTIFPPWIHFLSKLFQTIMISSFNSGSLHKISHGVIHAANVLLFLRRKSVPKVLDDDKQPPPNTDDVCFGAAELNNDEVDDWAGAPKLMFLPNTFVDEFTFGAVLPKPLKIKFQWSFHNTWHKKKKHIFFSNGLMETALHDKKTYLTTNTNDQTISSDITTNTDNNL